MGDADTTVTFTEGAKLVGVDPRQMRRYVEHKHIAPVTVDGKKRLRLVDVQDLAARRRAGKLPMPDRPDFDEDDEDDDDASRYVTAEHAAGLRALNESAIDLVKQSHAQICDLVKLITGPGQGVQDRMLSLLTMQDKRIAELEGSRDAMIAAREQALDHTHERELERADLEAQNRRIDAVLETVQQAAPLLLLSKSSDTSEEANKLRAAIGQFAAGLDEKTLKRLPAAKVDAIEALISLANQEKPSENGG